MKIVEINATTGKQIERELTAEETAELLASQNEAAWEALRQQRNTLLTASDWTQVADAPVDAAAWSTYRQALRDLPANTTDPTAPVWPTPPA